jgi:uncharacterized protein YjaZ
MAAVRRPGLAPPSGSRGSLLFAHERAMAVAGLQEAKTHYLQIQQERINQSDARDRRRGAQSLDAVSNLKFSKQCELGRRCRDNAQDLTPP